MRAAPPRGRGMGVWVSEGNAEDVGVRRVGSAVDRRVLPPGLGRDGVTVRHRPIVGSNEFVPDVLDCPRAANRSLVVVEGFGIGLQQIRLDRCPNERGEAPGAKGHSRPLDTEQLRAVWVLYQAASEVSPARRGELLNTDTWDPLVVREVLAMLEKAQGPVVPPPTEERRGQKIGRFHVKSRIGRGGMAEVYLARDTELDRDLALKFLPIGNRELRDRSHVPFDETKTVGV